MATEQSFTQRLFQPVDAASVAAFRVLFGALMLVLVGRYFAHGWIDSYYLQPHYFFPHFGFSWLHPLPGVGMYGVFALMGVGALGVMLGLYYRASLLLFAVLFSYAHLIDRTIYLNHYYLVMCLSALMLCSPLNRSGSLDVRRTPSLRVDTVPAWVLWALRTQFALVYFFGGVAKLRPDWLFDAQPLRTWLLANTDFPLFGAWFHEAWVAHAMSIAGALFDLSIVPLLLWRRSRPFAYLAVVAFHLITARLFAIGMFPWIMMAGSLLFLPADWPRRALRLLRPDAQGLGVRPQLMAPRATPSRVVPWALGVYFALHLLLPLRQFLYPGNVLWTEQGFRFSWSVMLMEKNGSLNLHVSEPSTGRNWRVAPHEYLTRYQTKMVSTQPDMIVDFAHVVARDFAARGVVNPRVTAESLVALNGRPMALLIDPDRDLAQETDSLAPKPWILPLPDSAEVPPTEVALK